MKSLLSTFTVAYFRNYLLRFIARHFGCLLRRENILLLALLLHYRLLAHVVGVLVERIRRAVMRNHMLDLDRAAIAVQL